MLRKPLNPDSETINDETADIPSATAQNSLNNTIASEIEALELEKIKKSGFGLEQIQYALKNQLANDHSIYFPGIAELTSRHSLDLQNLRDHGFKSVCFAFMSNKKHMSGAWIQLEKKPIIWIFDSQSNNYLNHKHWQLLLNTREDLKINYLSFFEDQKEENDDWSCGAYVLANLVSFTNSNHNGVRTPLDTEEWARKAYAAYIGQKGIEIKLAEIKVWEEQILRTLLEAIETNRYIKGFYQDSNSNDLFKSLADYLQMLLWGNLNRGEKPSDQKHRINESGSVPSYINIMENYARSKKENPADVSRSKMLFKFAFICGQSGMTGLRKNLDDLLTQLYLPPSEDDKHIKKCQQYAEMLDQEVALVLIEQGDKYLFLTQLFDSLIICEPTNILGNLNSFLSLLKFDSNEIEQYLNVIKISRLDSNRIIITLLEAITSRLFQTSQYNTDEEKRLLQEKKHRDEEHAAIVAEIKTILNNTSVQTLDDELYDCLARNITSHRFIKRYVGSNFFTNCTSIQQDAFFEHLKEAHENVTLEFAKKCLPRPENVVYLLDNIPDDKINADDVFKILEWIPKDHKNGTHLGFAARFTKQIVDLSQIIKALSLFPQGSEERPRFLNLYKSYFKSHMNEIQKCFAVLLDDQAKKLLSDWNLDLETFITNLSKLTDKDKITYIATYPVFLLRHYFANKDHVFKFAKVVNNNSEVVMKLLKTLELDHLSKVMKIERLNNYEIVLELISNQTTKKYPPHITLLAQDTGIDVEIIDDYYNNNVEKFQRISMLQSYLKNNRVGKHPALDLQNVLATTEQQYLNLKTTYRAIAVGRLNIMEAMKFSQEERRCFIETNVNLSDKQQLDTWMENLRYNRAHGYHQSQYKVIHTPVTNSLFKNVYSIFRSPEPNTLSNQTKNIAQSMVETNSYSNTKKKWKREGDFSVKPVVYYYDREVTYKYVEELEANIGKLIIHGFQDGTISIEYYNPSDTLFDEAMNKREGFDNHTVSKNRTDKWCIHLDRTLDKDKLVEFVELVDKYDSLSEIKDEIYGYMNVCHYHGYRL